MFTFVRQSYNSGNGNISRKDLSEDMIYKCYTNGSQEILKKYTF